MGRSAGTTTNAAGVTVPIHLTLSQSDELISGNLIIGDAEAIPVGEAIARGDELRFKIRSNSEQGSDVSLTFVVTGHPLSDKQIELHGSTTAAGQESEVMLYPVSDRPSYRTVVASAPA